MPRRITPSRDLATVYRLCASCERFARTSFTLTRPRRIVGNDRGEARRGSGTHLSHPRAPLHDRDRFRRWLLMRTEKVSCRLAHRVLAVSHSMRHQACEAGFCSPEKIVTPLCGSGNGVDAEGRFNPSQRRTRPARQRGQRTAFQQMPWSWATWGESCAIRGSSSSWTLGGECKDNFLAPICWSWGISNRKTRFRRCGADITHK